MDTLRSDILQQIDVQRSSQGFLTVSGLIQLGKQGNVILDPFSTLISSRVKLGSDNVFYPNAIVQACNEGSIAIGSGNIFYMNTFLFADQGAISIDNYNQFGDGGLSIKANTPGALITIGSYGRYLNGTQVMGRCVLGSGSQILGPITVQNCILGAGESYQHANPDARGGVLKGAGLARNLSVHQGEVLNGQGDFSQSQIQRQSYYHPFPITSKM